jgi:hypothetical protein
VQPSSLARYSATATTSTAIKSKDSLVTQGPLALTWKGEQPCDLNQHGRVLNARHRQS